MTAEQAIDQLKLAQKLFSTTGNLRMDIEAAHSCADNILCEFLISLGHKDVVEEWVKVPKWYS